VLSSIWALFCKFKANVEVSDLLIAHLEPLPKDYEHGSGHIAATAPAAAGRS
jgi:hypothetical protein